MQAQLRKLAVKAVRYGMTQMQAAVTHDVTLQAVSKWIKVSRDGALRPLKTGMRGRCLGGAQLSAKRAARVRALIVGEMRNQLTLPFCAWAQEAVTRLIELEYGITVSQTMVGLYLKD